MLLGSLPFAPGPVKNAASDSGALPLGALTVVVSPVGEASSVTMAPDSGWVFVGFGMCFGMSSVGTVRDNSRWNLERVSKALVSRL